MELYILVEMTVPQCATPGQIINFKDEPRIKTVLRSYESNARATQDLTLMMDNLPGRRFEVMAVEHID